ncbi:hypothetical protein SAMN05443529_11325 [Desulfosporosinus hippei DSM 8344]|uniref:Uncharacterized protein n=1 Tax=Desulfosporosinus hippei DSM 8344 TaxID=1121419 RepID=A0A1G8C823_9FIRM|nr:hypothetical protein SAMN05443529_11325 [Desulfosporosinus hippei DSM 8344]
METSSVDNLKNLSVVLQVRFFWMNLSALRPLTTYIYLHIIEGLMLLLDKGSNEDYTNSSNSDLQFKSNFFILLLNHTWDGDEANSSPSQAHSNYYNGNTRFIPNQLGINMGSGFAGNSFF